MPHPTRAEATISYWPVPVIIAGALGLFLIRGSGATRIIGFGLFVVALSLAIVAMFAQVSIGGTLSHAPPLHVREAYERNVIWTFFIIAVVVVPLLTALHLWALGRPDFNERLLRMDRVAGALFVYALAASFFGFMGLMMGGVGGEDSGAIKGALIGAAFGLLVAHLGRRAKRPASKPRVPARR